MSRFDRQGSAASLVSRQAAIFACSRPQQAQVSIFGDQPFLWSRRQAAIFACPRPLQAQVSILPELRLRLGMPVRC
ncbi:hypothetical protein NDU88_004144 [Pleurodeles waltl]|uniref:Uncharacterized protein n=1 Tax=Pleurodeles waltl TaxID=8319 RepID=A0AAV7MWD8_PLEWA|nr:hypothetical protein NDU88_004144 [Pleurodeles waltl]